MTFSHLRGKIVPYKALYNDKEKIMKKKILFACMLLAFTLMLCMGVMAQEATTYYLYDDGTALPEGENNISVSELYWQSETQTGLFSNLKDGDNIVIELKESISYTPTVGTMNNEPNKSNCLRINTASTVTVKFNGYSWWFTRDDAYDAFVVYNENATLNLIGTKAKNPDGTVKELGTNYKGSEINENIDVYSDFVIVYLAGGKLHCENLAAYCTEESIYQKDTYVSGRAELELVDSSIYTNSNYMYTVSIAGKGNSNNNLRIDGGLYGSICAHNLLDNSYIKNATVKEVANGNALLLDSWKGRNSYYLPIENSVIDGRYSGEGDSNIIIGKNSSFGILWLKGDSSGGTFMELIDCTYESVDFNGNMKTGQLTVYTSANCENAGTKIVYDINNVAGVVDESYSAPATGHKLDESKIIDIVYESYLEKGFYKSSCTLCGEENITEGTASAPALFTCLGYSAQEYANGGISISFVINKNAIEEYTEITGNSLSYGVFASSQKRAQDDQGTDKEIVNADGTVIDGVASVDFSKYDYDIFAIKIIGFETEEHKNVQLALGAYVIANGKVSYLQEGKPAEGNLYCYTSFNAQA